MPFPRHQRSAVVEERRRRKAESLHDRLQRIVKRRSIEAEPGQARDPVGRLVAGGYQCVELALDPLSYARLLFLPVPGPVRGELPVAHLRVEPDDDPCGQQHD